MDPISLSIYWKKVGFLSQKPYPLPMSIFDNVTFGPRIHRMNGQQLLNQIGNSKSIFQSMLFHRTISAWSDPEKTKK
jgi:ABC-type phosphate transport system ATPase subunit